MNFNIFQRKKPKNKPQTIDDIINKSQSDNGQFGALLFGGNGGNYSDDKALNLSAVYRATEVISNTIASLPLEVYRIDNQGFHIKDTKHPLYNLLNDTPNVRMSRFTFIKQMVLSKIMRGNGYAYIHRDANGMPIQLIWLPAEFVTLNPPTYLSEPPTYTITGVNGSVPHTDIIHILNYSYDGLIGISTLTHAATSLGIATDAENYAKGWFAGGCAVGGILKVHSSLNEKQKKELKQSWEQAFNPNTGKPNSVAVLEGNMDFTGISVNPADSQLLSTREFSVVEVARWFGISPIMLYDLKNTSYNDIESTNLSFLSDLTTHLEPIEQELNRKLFPNDNCHKVKFNVSHMLKTDRVRMADYFSKMAGIGALNVNEIRKEIDMLPIENGDTNFVQANLLSITNAANNVPSNSALRPENEIITDKKEK